VGVIQRSGDLTKGANAFIDRHFAALLQPLPERFAHDVRPKLTAKRR